MVLVHFNGFDYDVVNPIIQIATISFDVTKAEEFVKQNILSEEGELARLYLDVLGHPEYSVTWQINPTETKTITIPAILGIDLASATYNGILDYLSTSPRKLSESIKSLCWRVMAIRFPTDFKNEVDLVTSDLKVEFQLIDTHKSKDINFLGECGFIGKVRLDGK